MNPTTEAGRQLAESLYPDRAGMDVYRDLRAIAAIEAEARAAALASPELEARFWAEAEKWRKAGSGMTKDQETGAHMLWIWLREQGT